MPTTYFYSFVFQVSLTTKDRQPIVTRSHCTCKIGLSGACGHITGVLYQFAKYKLQGLKAIPVDIAKTSQPQTWHVPRGATIPGKVVQDLIVSGHSKIKKPSLEDAPRTIKSTLYNPIRGQPINWNEKCSKLIDVSPELLVIPATCIQETNIRYVSSKFGPVPRDSVLSYQQRLEDNCILNVFDGIGFQELPAANVMLNNYNAVMTSEQSIKLEGLRVTLNEIQRFEEETRLQSQTPLWYKIRRNRITASTIGEIFKRRKEAGSLVQRLQSTRHVMTAAMRQGLALEPVAAKAYAEELQNRVNLYPCGVVISLWSPWIAASPDRKVYNPERFPAFGLLEIKCPQVSSVLEVPYLAKDETGILKLKRNHNYYYYQVLAQLAVTGLDLCDLFVWCPKDHHLETIYLNRDVWNAVKDKVDIFYFSHFL